jgi:hypothetical protein
VPSWQTGQGQLGQSNQAGPPGGSSGKEYVIQLL